MICKYFYSFLRCKHTTFTFKKSLNDCDTWCIAGYPSCLSTTEENLLAEIVAQSFPVNKVFGINSQNLQEKIRDGVLFSDTTFIKKGLNTNKLMLIENNNLISEESVLANTMNQYFTNITKQLNIKKSDQLKDLEFRRHH